MPAWRNYIDGNYIPAWFQNATIQGFVWCEIDGVEVAGSSTVASVIPVPQTGNTLQDVADFLLAWFLDADGFGPVGDPVIDPSGTFAEGYGVSAMPPGNTYLVDPGVYIEAGTNYDFGDLNLPSQTTSTNARNWHVKFTAVSTANEGSPPWPLIVDYITANARNPVLHVIELKSIE